METSRHTEDIDIEEGNQRIPYTTVAIVVLERRGQRHRLAHNDKEGALTSSAFPVSLSGQNVTTLLKKSNRASPASVCGK